MYLALILRGEGTVLAEVTETQLNDAAFKVIRFSVSRRGRELPLQIKYKVHINCLNYNVRLH